MQILKVKKSQNYWVLPQEKSQTTGSEWTRHSQLTWFGQCRWGNNE